MGKDIKSSNIQTISRTYDVFKSFGGDKGVYLGRFDAGMAKHFLNVT